MREGKYVIDSIENGLVKLLYSQYESIEEVVNKEQFFHPIKQGDVQEISYIDTKMTSIILEDETKKRRKLF